MNRGYQKDEIRVQKLGKVLMQQQKVQQQQPKR